MGNYIECRNDTYNKLRVTFWRTRYDGMTLYKGSVTPCSVDTRHGLTCEKYEPQNGYKFTLNAVKRASRKAEDSARVELQWFILRALDLLAGNGFETVLSGSDLNASVTNIVKSIECEVH